MHFLSVDIVRKHGVKYQLFLKHWFQNMRGLMCLYVLQKESLTVDGWVNIAIVFYWQVAQIGDYLMIYLKFFVSS